MQILYGVEARKSAGYCAMYDICGARTDGKVLNCPYNIPAVKVRVTFHLLLLADLIFDWSKMQMIFLFVQQ